MDFPIKNGESFHSYVKLPEGRQVNLATKIQLVNNCLSIRLEATIQYFNIFHMSPNPHKSPFEIYMQRPHHTTGLTKYMDSG